MYTGKQEQLNTQMNVDQTNKEDSSNEPLIEREQIEGTPFWLVKLQEKYNLVMGKYKLNDKELTSKEDVYKFLETEIYNVLIKVVMIFLTDYMKDVNITPKKKDNLGPQKKS